VSDAEREAVLQARPGSPVRAIPGPLLRAGAGPLAELGAQLLLLVAIAQAVGLGRVGWMVGAASGLTFDVVLADALRRNAAARLGPADWVTLTRATFAVGVAALTADSFERGVPVTLLVTLASVALALDFVDGLVARRTKTESALGARLDGEVDAFLILALSVMVARSAGAWVVAIGAARYVFLAGGWPFTWMRAPLPHRDWRKTVTAAQGIALTVAAAQVVPLTATRVLLAVALVLLAESFGRDVWWLWRHRLSAAVQAAARRDPDRGAGVVLTLLAAVIVWVALVAPVQPWPLTAQAFIRLPLEGIVIATLALVLPGRARRLLPWVIGPVLGLLALVKVLDIGFFTTLGRPFNPVDDWSFGRVGMETVRETFGGTAANLTVVGAVLLAVAALVLPTLAVRRLTHLTARHRRSSIRVLAALGTVWVACWALGANLVSGANVASTSSAVLAVDEVRAVQADLADHARFSAAIQHDPYRSIPADRLLTGLRGKDVLVVFVESYGKLTLEGNSFSPRIDSVVDTGTRQLAAAGFSARSGWLTAPNFGGASWLAHSTLQSGTWVNSQGRYNELVKSNRLTLAEAFRRAGWRTVADMPANDRDWSTGLSFYHFDKLYDRRNVGYRGPKYAYASMPDQYVLLALQRRELAKRHRRPVFAEVPLVSSHAPWTRIPPLIDWRRVGDGSIFNRLPVDETGQNDKRQGYARSIEYTLRTLSSFVQHYGRRNLVLIVLGDEQPARIVAGSPGHDVPISIVAHDPAVLQQIAGWGWVDGMEPTPAAPVERMSAFRNRFLNAYGS
jgi:phosphatidylglycerophosphate synthase